jgi:hypothetical protein
MQADTLYDMQAGKFKYVATMQLVVALHESARNLPFEHTMLMHTCATSDRASEVHRHSRGDKLHATYLCQICAIHDSGSTNEALAQQIPEYCLLQVQSC